VDDAGGHPQHRDDDLHAGDAVPGLRRPPEIDSQIGRSGCPAAILGLFPPEDRGWTAAPTRARRYMRRWLSCTSPRQPPVSAPRCSMNFLKSLTVLSTCEDIAPSASPMFSSAPWGSYAIVSRTRVRSPSIGSKRTVPAFGASPEMLRQEILWSGT